MHNILAELSLNTWQKKLHDGAKKVLKIWRCGTMLLKTKGRDSEKDPPQKKVY